ncbi:MAG TPA: TlpA disulfide reductase family protein [Opitutaceae bacterium]|nr:TlpA disulfide reductase family protein [Opitutaceae bacterium]
MTVRFHRLFLVPLLLALGLALSSCQPVKLPMLGQAPAWKFKDLDGKEIPSEQFRGKVVMLDFWATWCVPCVEEIPRHIQLQQKYGADGLVIVGVSLDETGAEHVRQFAKTKGLNYQVVMAKLDEVEAVFGGMEAMPTKLLVDRTGQIRDRQVGPSPDDYEKKVKSLLR